MTAPISLFEFIDQSVVFRGEGGLVGNGGDEVVADFKQTAEITYEILHEEGQRNSYPLIDKASVKFIGDLVESLYYRRRPYIHVDSKDRTCLGWKNGKWQIPIFDEECTKALEVHSKVKEVDAINIPLTKQIYLSRKRWNRKNDVKQIKLVIHELLGLFGADYNNSISNKFSVFFSARKQIQSSYDNNEDLLSFKIGQTTLSGRISKLDVGQFEVWDWMNYRTFERRKLSKNNGAPFLSRLYVNLSMFYIGDKLLANIKFSSPTASDHKQEFRSYNGVSVSRFIDEKTSTPIYSFVILGITKDLFSMRLKTPKAFKNYIDKNPYIKASYIFIPKRAELLVEYDVCTNTALTDCKEMLFTFKNANVRRLQYSLTNTQDQQSSLCKGLLSGIDEIKNTKEKLCANSKLACNSVNKTFIEIQKTMVRKCLSFQ